MLQNIPIEESRNGKRYLNLDFMINGSTGEDLMNCECYITQKPEEWGKPKDILFHFRTLDNHRAFMEELYKYKNELSQHRVYQEQQEDGSVDNADNAMSDGMDIKDMI